jgi:hypothetical protein
VAVLLLGFESVTPFGGATEAVLITLPDAVLRTVAVRLKVAVPLTRRLTVVLMLPLPLAAPQLEPFEATQVHEALVRFAGMVSLTGAFVTVLGPLFLTTILYVVLMPAMTVLTPFVFVIERSACGVSWLVSDAVSLFGFVSTAPLGISSLAVFVTVPVADGLTVPVSWKVAVPLTSKSTLVLIFPTPVAAEHADPVEAVHVHETLEKTAGGLSVTGIPKTALGPLFLTTIVYVVAVPGTMDVLLSVFVIERSVVVEQKGMLGMTLLVVPSAPRVAPLGLNSGSALESVSPFTPPLTEVVMAPPV